MPSSSTHMRGWGYAEWTDPITGAVERVKFFNLITVSGDQMYAERGAGITGAPNAPTGMRLGTGANEPAKTGADAVLGAYVAGSTKAFDPGFPTSAAVGSVRRITYRCTWPAGTATASGIVEVVLTNENPIASGAGTSGNTVARALLRPARNKTADVPLSVTWFHDTLGA